MVTKIYANAVAKYNEGKLLDAEKLRRLADADFESAVKMLCDHGYGGGTVHEGQYDIDAFITRETGKLIDYVLSDAPDPRLARLLTARFLYGNAKAYYKSKASGRYNEAAVYPMADAAVREGIEKGEYAALPSPMAEALARLDALFSESAPDPKTIDIALTKAMFAEERTLARALKNKPLQKFVTVRIDTANISAVLRARALGMPWSALTEMTVAGGKLSEERLRELFEADDAAKELRETDYGVLAGEDETLSLPRIETRADDTADAVWETDAQNMQSFSPFVRYFYAQLREYKTVKMILTCLKNNAREEIAVRLRQVL